MQTGSGTQAVSHELVVLDFRPELPRINVPMTVLFVIPPDASAPPDQLEQALRESYGGARGARIVRIENARHFIQIDQPQRFVEEVRAFMR